MTKEDVERIFSDFVDFDGYIVYEDNINTSVNKFLTIAGFEKAPENPTKQDLHDIDKGVKGYATLIEVGNYKP